MRAPTVSAARLRSRSSDARASRSSNRTNSANGHAGDPGHRGQDERHDEGHDEQDGRRRGGPARRPSHRLPRGRMSRPATPTSANTAMSQRSRARRAVGRSRRALSASTGEMRPARRAGSMRRRERHDDADGEGREGVVDGHDRSAERHRADRPHPGGDARREQRHRARRPAATRRCRWPWPGRGCRRSAVHAIAPAARRSPSSRTRSTTVIDSVLKIRKAPANSAMAPISAVVAAKSPVDARIEAPMSCGEDRT